MRQLELIANLPSNTMDFSEQHKIEFFNDTRQSFGNTALLLHGGATFGKLKQRDRHDFKSGLKDFIIWEWSNV